MKFEKIGNTPILEIVYEDSNCVVFAVEKHIKGRRPYFRVNGSQEGHYTKKGKGTGLLMPGQYAFGHNNDWTCGHFNMFIFKFKIKDGLTDNSTVFSKSFEEALERLDLKDAIIEGKSYGGIIALRLAGNSRVKKVFLVNPVCQGSPLADYKKFKTFRYGCNPLRWLVKLSQALTFRREVERDGQLAFTNEKRDGINLSLVEKECKEKIVVIGGNVVGLRPTTFMELIMFTSADVIFDMSGKKNDGTVTFDIDLYRKFRIKVYEMLRASHEKTQEEDYNLEVFKIILQELGLEI